MALRISSTNILILFTISFPDMSVSRSIKSIGSSGYLDQDDFYGSKKHVRLISGDVDAFENHVKMLKQVNGFKHHNVFNTHKDVGPLVYIINPLEAKVPKAYLTLNEFKQAIIDRVVRLKSNTRKNTVFMYTGKVAPTRTPFIGRNGRIDIKHSNWKRKTNIAHIRSLLERKVTPLKSKTENDRKDIKYRTTAVTKLKLRQHTKSYETNLKPKLRSEDIKSVLKSRNSSKSDHKRTVVKSSNVQQKITCTTMSTIINHPAIRISHASIHGIEDGINFKEKEELSNTNVKEISGLKKETSSKTKGLATTASDITISNEATPKSAESNKTMPMVESTFTATEVDISSKTATETREPNTIETKKDVFSEVVTNTDKSSTAANNAGEYSTVLNEKDESSILVTGTEKCTIIAEKETSSSTVTEIEKSSTTISEMEISSTTMNEMKESNTAITETDESSTAISKTEEPITTVNADVSDTTSTIKDVATFAEETVTTEVETSPTVTEETTTVATEAPVTQSKWRPHTLSRPLVFMGKGMK